MSPRLRAANLEGPRRGERVAHEGSLSRGAMVYEMVREWIAAGQLRPGERLSEEELARRTGVSRTPVREALKRLEAEGFVQVIPYRGVVVAEPSVDEVADLCVVRDVLEELAARSEERRVGTEGGRRWW